MTDKELLTLAAKAAGIELHWNAAGMPTVPYYFSEEGEAADWNPLADDGDALRLAVKLRLQVEWDADGEPRIETATEYLYEPIGDDLYAATRRAIVRAVAEIGKEMK